MLGYDQTNFVWGAFRLTFEAFEDNGVTYTYKDVDRFMNISAMLHHDLTFTYKKEKVFSEVRPCNKDDWDEYFKDTEESTAKMFLDWYW